MFHWVCALTQITGGEFSKILLLSPAVFSSLPPPQLTLSQKQAVYIVQMIAKNKLSSAYLFYFWGAVSHHFFGPPSLKSTGHRSSPEHSRWVGVHNVHAYSWFSVPSFSVQATERMKIVDVLGVKQFSDGERIITQVRRGYSWCGDSDWNVWFCHTHVVQHITPLKRFIRSLFSSSSGWQGWLLLCCRIWGGEDHDEE